jgi:hypothetical protein
MLTAPLLLLSILNGFHLCSSSAVAQADTPVKYFNVIEKLHADLMENYNPQIRPVLNHTQAVDLEISFKLVNYDLEEKAAEFKIHGFLSMKWKDPRLNWSADAYEGLKSIHLPNARVWLPDIELYNSAENHGEHHDFGSVNVLVFQDGTVMYVPPTTLISKCYPNRRYWPYDTQDCNIKIGSWTHDANKLNISPPDGEVTIEVDNMDTKNDRWNLLGTSVELQTKVYKCCVEPYQSLLYSFSFQRVSPNSWSTIILPSLAIAVLSLIALFIPPKSNAKIIIGVLNLGLICGYNLYLDSVLKGTGSSALIATFFGLTLVLAVFSVITSVISFYWIHQMKSAPPTFIKNILGGRLGSILGGTQQKTTGLKNIGESTKSSFPEMKNDEIYNIQEAWIELSFALCHVLFYVSCACFIIMFLVIFN